MKKPTHSALSAILKVTADALGKDAWVRFKTLPADTQAHLLCEAYLATLRERTLPGAKVEVAAPPVNMMDEFIPTPLREAAQEGANKLHTLLEKETTRGKYKKYNPYLDDLAAFGLDRVKEETPNTVTSAEKATRGKYKSRIKLRYTLRAFYAGTGRVIHLTPKSFNIETTQELRDTAAKIASDIASGWCRTETDGYRVTLRKKARDGEDNAG